MSEFIFVIPEGWRRIDISSTGMSAPTIASIISGNVLVSITETLRNYEIIGLDETVSEAKLFNDEVFIIKTV